MRPGDTVILPDGKEGWLFSIISYYKEPIYRVLVEDKIFNFREGVLKEKEKPIVDSANIIDMAYDEDEKAVYATKKAGAMTITSRILLVGQSDEDGKIHTEESARKIVEEWKKNNAKNNDKASNGSSSKS